MRISGISTKHERPITEGINVTKGSVDEGQNIMPWAQIAPIQKIANMTKSGLNQIKKNTYLLFKDCDTAGVVNSRVLSAIKQKNRQFGICGANEVLLPGHVIKSEFCRYQNSNLQEKTRADLIYQRLLLDNFILR